MFDSADVDGGGDLDQQEFVEAFQSILGEGLSDKELTQLFMKIDANSDGNVDWEEFINYMVFQEGGRDGMGQGNVAFTPTPNPDIEGVSLSAYHREAIECITVLPGKRLVTAAHDGTIRVWSQESMAPLKTLQIGSSWICSMAVIPLPGGVYILALGRVNRSIDFVDIGIWETVGSISSMESSPLSLSYRPALSHTQPAALLVGDDAGTLVCINHIGEWIYHKTSIDNLRTTVNHDPEGLRNASRALYTRLCNHTFARFVPKTTAAVSTGGGGSPVKPKGKIITKKANFALEDVPADSEGPTAQAHSNALAALRRSVNTVIASQAIVTQTSLKQQKRATPHGNKLCNAAARLLMISALNLHSDWISEVVYVSDIDMVITASFDGHIKAVDPTCTGVRRVFNSTGRNIVSMSYSIRNRLIAACSSDWVVTIFNPYLPRPTATLNDDRTHHVGSISFADRTNQLIGLCPGTKDIVIWSAVTHQVTQVIHDKPLRAPEDRLGLLLFDSHGPSIIATSNRPHVWRIDPEQEKSVSLHSAPITQALFNTAFDVVVSTDAAGCVFVWDYSDGRLVFRYSEAHGDARLAAIAFDGTCRRLLTTGSDGSRHVWNFHNGQKINTLETVYPGECAAALYIEHPTTPLFAVAGWDRHVSLYADNEANHDAKVIPPMRVIGPHADDITCMAFHPPNILVTGVYGGHFYVWNSDSTFLRFIFDATGKRVRLGVPANSTPAGTDGYLDKVDESLGVVSVFFAEHLGGHLLTVCDDDYLRLWSISHDQSVKKGAILIATARLARSVTSVTLSESNEVLITGHSSGRVRTWSTFALSEFLRDNPVHADIEPCTAPVARMRSFPAHRSAVVTVDYLATPSGSDEPFILTGSKDTRVKLWTLGGKHLGSFGQKTWPQDSVKKSAVKFTQDTKIEKEGKPPKHGSGDIEQVNQVPAGPDTAVPATPEASTPKRPSTPPRSARPLPSALMEFTTTPVRSRSAAPSRKIYNIEAVEPPRTPHLDNRKRATDSQLMDILMM
ncbi:EF-hand domain pair [Carpediemonas membranifera]|uniref:EF-hand domain pair n=1 Tax=Carpediemonas membranifera TaxID=201153 RepID=A0A8J6DZF3_9EUKA|nr:EF-hand domain pair [Carpediemonas membranifera]|eukprot:KAG9390326.1 EF-hand domain pair [Carpediemonas membranifera]